MEGTQGEDKGRQKEKELRQVLESLLRCSCIKCGVLRVSVSENLTPFVVYQPPPPSVSVFLYSWRTRGH